MPIQSRFWICVLLAIVIYSAGDPLALADDIDATTLHKKVLTGDQGWFRCPGDGGKVWKHWSRNGQRIAPETLTFEMWSDLSEFTEAEKYPAPGFTHEDGSDLESEHFAAQTSPLPNFRRKTLRLVFTAYGRRHQSDSRRHPPFQDDSDSPLIEYITDPLPFA